ncbi:short-chain collagen C4-like [Saccostrea echinata]|uniref:short-chain collagen C4-like n=1 Tax=Saccostrea echinata TaxID=191078 RepID=UPI002A80C182|nr:short-chain collagen C4-like [Saccostrea echinata]
MEKRFLINNGSPEHSQFQDLQSGALFIRWGRKTCPDNTTDLVYSGYAGSSDCTKTGGPADFLCLVPDPDMVPDVGSGQYIKGVEYDHGIAGSKVGQDVPCAVCRSRSEETSLMLPGKSSCYPGWKIQYRGYLASGNEAFKSSANYICLDEHSEQSRVGDSLMGDGKLLYTVRIA